uniref:Secreted protein n=1 Tax=Heterorhabditis bacteriophora TaxID=37862 RepID=A0A1I7W8M4_HETBA
MRAVVGLLLTRTAVAVWIFAGTELAALEEARLIGQRGGRSLTRKAAHLGLTSTDNQALKAHSSVELLEYPIIENGYFSCMLINDCGSYDATRPSWNRVRKMEDICTS